MKIAIVLPRGMHFGPEGATSIDLVTRDLLSHSRFRDSTTVLGEAVAIPFPGVAFQAVDGTSQKDLTRGYARALRHLQPDVIVVHQHPETAAALAKQLAGTPVILHRHGLLKEKRSGLSRWLKSRLFRRLSLIVFVSDFIEDRFLTQFPGLAGRTTVIVNGVDMQVWAPSEKDRTIAYVGRAREDKGLLPLINAFTDLSKHPAASGWGLELVLGVQTEAEEAFADRLEALAARKSGIRIRRNLPSTEVRDTLARASIAALPSIVREGFPRAVVEAMACGCATIATAQGGTLEAAGDAALLLDNPSAPDFKDRLRHALLGLIENDPHRQELGQHARTHAEATLGIAAVAARYDALLASAARVG